MAPYFLKKNSLVLKTCISLISGQQYPSLFFLITVNFALVITKEEIESVNKNCLQENNPWLFVYLHDCIKLRWMQLNCVLNVVFVGFWFFFFMVLIHPFILWWILWSCARGNSLYTEKIKSQAPEHAKDLENNLAEKDIGDPVDTWLTVNQELVLAVKKITQTIIINNHIVILFIWWNSACCKKNK